LRILSCLAEAWSFLREVAREFNDDNGGIVAAAIAFYAFTSLIPLLLLGISALGFFLRSDTRTESIVFGLLRSYSPALAEQGAQGVSKVVEEIVQSRGTIGGLGLIGLVWTGSQAFANLQRAVNIAWDTPNDRGFLKTRLLAIAMLVAVGLLLLVSLGLTTLLNIVQSYDVSLFGVAPQEIPLVWTLAAYAIPLIVTIVMLTLMYNALPTRKVPISAALASGVVAGLLWEAAKYAFGWYVANFANYSAVYGSLAGLIVLIFWIYYSSMILIFAAEFGATLARRLD